MAHRLMQVCTDKNRLSKWEVTTKKKSGKVQNKANTINVNISKIKGP